MDKGQLMIRETLEKIRNNQMSPQEGFQLIRELQKASEETSLLYFQSTWEKADIATDGADPRTARHILLFDTVEPDWALLQDKQVVRVQPGTTFQVVGPNVYEINPEKPEDYKKLVEALAQQGIVPERVLHLWARKSFTVEEEALQRQLHLSIYSLLYLCQALVAHDVSIVYGYVADENGNPAFAALPAFARSLRLEQINFAITTLEVGPSDASALLALALQEPLISDVAEVRYENNIRMIKGLQEFESQPVQTSLPWNKNGVYVITGGAGGLGLIFAEYLTRQVQGTVVLTGRSDLDADKMQRILAMQREGVEVRYEKVDVAKRKEVEQFVADVKARYGTIHGVIHSAGVLRDCFAIQKTSTHLEDVLAPKVIGTVNLALTTAGEELDFFVMFSSIASVRGNFGQVDYAFGNRFMDNFAARLQGQHPNTKFLSINWPLWQDGGMEVDEETKSYLDQTLGLVPLRTPSGIGAFEVGLQSSLSSVLVVEGKVEKIRETLKADKAKQQPDASSNGMIGNEVGNEQQVLLREKTEAFLKELLSKQTKISVSRIDTQNSLESYGIDSVMIMGLTRELEGVFGELSKTLFFEYQNLSGLAEYFLKRHPQKLLEKFGDSIQAPVQTPTVHKSTVKAQERVRNSLSELKSRFLPAKVAETAAPYEPERGGQREDIAIVGVSGRYPFAANLEELWQNFKAGRDCITEIPKERWDLEKEYDPTGKQAGMSSGKWGGFLEDIDKFDPLFFSISPKEAQLIDPQERLFLQTVWHTLEDGGYTRASLAAKRVGVFVGVMYGHYQLYGAEETLRGNRIALNSSYASIANRVSYFFNFHGPSLAVDTMCSSSLTAIHLAIESLHRGESEVAVAGGVNLSLHPNKYMALSSGNFLSSDGRCRTFGEGGDGYVPSEGVGAVLLKPLKQAEADGDQIYAVIKGSSINHGGKTNGYTVPNPVMQGELIAETLKKAQINPRTISYLEAHGTGTSLGDPIEITGLMRAFQESTDELQFCSIGSAKSNMGHMESAAGIVGLTKILLQFKHQQLVPSIHSESLNPNINFQETPFYVQRKLSEWKRSVIVENGVAQEVPRRAGISAFGAGGSNAHLILEEYGRTTSEDVALEPKLCLILLSAKSESRLQEQVRSLAAYLQQEQDVNSVPAARLEDLAYTLQIGREAMDIRLALLVKSKAELLTKLQEVLSGKQEIQGAWKGDLEQQSHQTLLLKQDSEDLEYIRSVVSKGNLEKIAALWSNGTEIDWRLLYRDRKLKRISLPLYPFEKGRYWVPKSTGTAKTRIESMETLQKGLHPLVDANESTLDVEVFRKTLRAEEFFIRDHIVSGQAILPGTAYLEMVRAAGEFAAKRRVQEIRDVMWVRPLIVEENRDVYIAFYPEEHGVEYEVYSEVEQERILHSTGRLLYEDEEMAQLSKGTFLDLQAIKQQCTLATRHKAELYDIFKEIGFAYGNAFQVTQEVVCGEREAIAKLVLPVERQADLNLMHLHPSLLDGALRATFGIGNSYARNKFPNVPFSLERLEIYKPLPRVCYVYVTLSSPESSPHDPITKCQITICDEQGEVLVRISEFTARQFAQHKTEQVEADGLYFFQPQWEPVLLQAGQSLPSNETVLVLADATSPFHTQPHDSRQYVIVQPGESYQEVGREHYCLNPNRPEHYLRLVQELHAKGLQPTHILHLWSQHSSLEWESAEQVEKVFEQMEAGLDTGLYSCVYLLQAYTKEWPSLRAKMLFAFPGGVHADSPLHEAVAGLANALPAINTRFELFTLQYSQDIIASPTFAQRLLKELTAVQNSNGTEICYAGEQRLVRRIRSLPISAPAASLEQAPLKKQGVYLLTGGAGGLGLMLARELAKKQQARLVLIGRSAVNERIEGQLQELQTLGASAAVYVQANVAHLADVQHAVQVARTQFGEINGVFHVAGLAADTPFAEADRMSFEKILQPKVQGTLHLDIATQQDKLDVFVLFSSISALIGDFGGGSYSYANSFLDRYAAQREQLRAAGKRHGNTVSVNWPLWQGGGLELTDEQEAVYFASTGMRMIEANLGMAALATAMQVGFPQLVVAYGVEAKIRKLLNADPSTETSEESVGEEVADTTLTAEVGTSGTSEDERLFEETVTYLKEKVSEAIQLPIHLIQARTALEKYGIDSIMIMELNKLLEPDFSSLPKTLFFEYKNLHDLAAYFVKEHAEKMVELCGLTSQQAVKEVAGQTVQVATISKASQPAKLKSRFAQTRSLVATPTPQQSEHTGAHEDIAIIGVSGRYPMARNLDEFWENLKQGKDCITEIPADRWDYKKYFDPQKGKIGKMYSKWGGFLERVDCFDPLFFNISPRDAEMIDPQERLFLETAWQTVEDAGYARSELSGKNVGVFVGAMYSHYQMFGDVDRTDELLPGSFFSSIANRVSYVMNFSGPSLTVDTACSSALEAVRLGCLNIWNGNCEMAIAGGVNVTIHPHKYLFLSQSNFLSSDGRCRSFGAGGDGYVPGEGVGAVLLKPLKKAVADGDHIYAVVKGVSVNHGGKTNGYTVPNPNAHAELIADAMKQAHIDPRTISYMEAHGTGTPLGDPIEVTGLTKAFREFTEEKQFCSLGSVKSNIGHLESAAGISGITKLLLQMKHKQLVPTLHAQTVNPNIEFAATPFYLQQELTEWKRPVLIENGQEITYPRRAGISGFGAGGTNVHLILEEYENSSATPTPSNSPQIVVLSAKNTDRLRASAQQLLQALGQSVEGSSARAIPKEEHLNEKVSQDILEMVSSSLRVNKSDIDIVEDMLEYGLDTINFSELATTINLSYNLDIQPIVISQYPSIQALGSYLVSEFGDACRERLLNEPVGVADVKVQEPLSLKDLCYTLQTGREAMAERLALVVSNMDELRQKLQAFLNDDKQIEGVCRGTVKSNHVELESLVEGKEGEEFVKGLIQSLKLDKVARLWTQGVDIHWQIFYENKSPHRLSLPTYPFAGESYWTQRKEGGHGGTASHTGVAWLHPLIERNTSNLRFTKLATTFGGDEFFLSTGNQDEKTLPAILLLEMMRVAGEIVAEQKVTRLVDVEWSGMWAINASEEFEIRLDAGDEGVECEVCTVDSVGNTGVHGRATLAFDRPYTGNGPVAIDTENMIRRTSMMKSAAECRQLLLQTGVRTTCEEPVLLDCRHSQTEALSQLRFPQAMQASRHEFVVHPVLLEAMLQTVIVLLNNVRGSALHSIGELEIFRPLTECCQVYAELIEREGDLVIFDVQVVDETGHVAVQVSDLAVRTDARAGSPDMLEMLRKLQTGDVSATDVKQYMGVT